MVLRVRRGAKGVSRVLIPRLRIEQLMWLIWWPLIAFWILLPFVSVLRNRELPAVLTPVGALTNLPGYSVLCWAAALLAVFALHASVKCWRHMGRHWRMGIDPSQDLELLTDGPFSWARHPIYSLGMLIMLCTVMVIPSPIMLGMAATHVLLLNLKAANEERFLSQRFGSAYARYIETTGRLLPRWSRITSAIHGDDLPDQRSTFGARYGRGVLDPFQQAMLSWEALHPYNAVHAIRVDGAFDHDALCRAISIVSDAAGVGEFRIDAVTQKFAYSPGGVIAVTQLADAVDSDELLCKVAAGELNTPFPPGVHVPLRWLAWNECDANAHWIVLVYQHVVADGVAAEALLRAVACGYRGDHDSDGGAAAITTIPAERLMHPIRRIGISRCFSTAMRIHKRLRVAHKMPDERDRGDSVDVQSAMIESGDVNRLYETCRAAGIGLNDLLIAALASAVAQATPDRHQSRRRRKIALATMLSTRPRDALRTVFGVYVTDAVLLVERPDVAFDEVLQQVVDELRPWKADREQSAGVAAMRFWLVRHVWPLFGLPHDRRSYRKVFPICGGVSTANIRESEGTPLRGVSRYVRVVPCGPAAPLALAATRLDDRLGLVLTHRLSSQSGSQARALLTSIRSRLLAWSSGAVSNSSGANGRLATTLAAEHGA